MKHSIEGTFDPESDDGGQALIAHIEDAQGQVYFHVHSWDPNCIHKDIRPFLDKRVRITIEVLE